MSNVAPVKTRTWQYDVNQVIVGETTQAGGPTDAPEYRKRLLLAIKDSMIGFATLPWTVEGSASYNDAAGAMDATDRWVDIDDIRFVSGTSSQRSWIVLENAALGIQFLFDCRCGGNSDGSLCDAWITPVGTPFTGGSSTARPTSASEIQISNGNFFDYRGAWGSGDDNNFERDYVLHVMHSEDGLSTRVIILINGVTVGFWNFDRIEDPRGSMTYQFIFRMHGLSSDVECLTDTEFYTNPRAWYGITNGGVVAPCYVPQLYNVEVIQLFRDRYFFPNPYDGRSSAQEVWVMSTAANYYGVVGRLDDIWVAPPSSFNGRLYPAGTGDFIAFGNLLLPWNGTNPIVR